jgi:hypothetical protein
VAVGYYEARGRWRGKLRIATLCRALLESDPGVEVSEASNGRAHYSAYSARMPDIPITDFVFLACLDWNGSPHFSARAASQDHHIQHQR